MKWDEKYGWAPPITSFKDVDGRNIDLISFSIESTHSGVLEGTPSTRSVKNRLRNDPKFCKQPVFVLPKNALPHPDEDLSKDFLLPAYLVEMVFECDAIQLDGDEASRLRIIYLTNDHEDFSITVLIIKISSNIKQYFDLSYPNT